MKIDAIFSGELTTAPSVAARAERLGFDGLVSPEVAHDPFLPLALAAGTTQRLRLSTGIAVAFARNPMTVAVAASDIHRLSGGRFVLGLGSQIRAHITKRFSMPWSPPAARMAAFIAGLRAIWQAWEDGSPLAFRSEQYRHTLMTPMFSHGPSPWGWPPIALAAVGPTMTALAGQVADGLIAHGFTTASYLDQVTLPHLHTGLVRAGRARAAVEVCVPAMAVVADDEADPAVARARASIAFYGSTPAYRAVLDHHGWGELGEELHRLSLRGAWSSMGEVIDDEVLHTFAVVGGAADVARGLRARYGGLADRLYLGLDADDATTGELVAALR